MSQNYRSTCSKLQDYDLEEALAIIKRAAANFSRQDIVNKAQAIREDYNRMQNIFVHGHDDEKREELFNQLFERAWALDSELCYLSEKDNRQYEPIEGDTNTLLEQLASNPTDDAYLNAVFEHVIATHPMTNDERHSLHLAILDEQLPSYVRATLLSALTLYLQITFDARIIENLYTYTLDDQPIQLQMQAWVTLVLVAFWHKDRIKHLPRLKEQYSLLCESNPALLIEIQRTLLMTELAPKIQAQTQKLLADREGDAGNDEQKMQRLQDFFREIGLGVDLSYSTFKMFCRHSFFSRQNTRHHWLEPFSYDQPTIKRALERQPSHNNVLRMLTHASNQSATDKYLAVLCAPALGDDSMKELSQKLEEMDIKFEEPMPIHPVNVMQNYVHDLYRYFTLHPYLSENDRRKLDATCWLLSANPWLRPVAEDVEQLRSVAELCHHHKLSDSVIAKAYTDLLAVEQTETGYLRLAKAIRPTIENGGKRSRILLECIDLFPDCREAYVLLADQYDEKHQYIEEKHLLLDALAQMPNQEDLLWRLGRSLVELNLPEQALETLFKADLAHEGNAHTQLELSRAYLLQGKLQQAVHYAELAIESPKLNAMDRGWGGVILMANGDYLRAYEQLKRSSILLLEPLFADVIKLLEPYGVPPHDLALMRTQVLRYDNTEINQNTI